MLERFLARSFTLEAQRSVWDWWRNMTESISESRSTALQGSMEGRLAIWSRNNGVRRMVASVWQQYMGQVAALIEGWRFNSQEELWAEELFTTEFQMEAMLREWRLSTACCTMRSIFSHRLCTAMQCAILPFLSSLVYSQSSLVWPGPAWSRPVQSGVVQSSLL